MPLAAALALSLGACAAPPANSSNAAAILAPTGTLRVGVYAGSPSSIVQGRTLQDAKGVGFDLGKDLAAKLGVPFQPVVFASNAEVFAAAQSGRIDVTFTNATPERARHLDFSRTFMDVEKSFLVPAASPLASYADLQRPGVRVGVSAGSTTAQELHAVYPRAVLIPVPTLAAASQMLASGTLDAFATNDAILFEMADGLTGSHVLPGHWGMEHFGAAIPQGRRPAIAYLSRLVDQARADGTVQRAIARANLRGTVPQSP